MTVFDDNVDALEVVEDHAQAVLQLQDDQAEKILKVYQRVANQLRSRLRRLPRDTFSAQQVRVTLAQLEGAILALEKELNGAVVDGAGLMVDSGINDLVTEIRVFNDEFSGAVQPISLDLVQSAVDTKARLINNYQVSINAYSRGLRQQISDGLMNMVVERVGSEVMYQRLIEEDAIGGFFEGEAWKLRRIVRTELHGMYGEAKLDSLDRIAEDEPELRKALYHPRDHRTGDDSEWLIAETAAGRLNGKHNGLERRLRPKTDEPFLYVWAPKDARGKRSGKRYRREFQAPPDRPNDRSILIPYHPSWD